MLKLEDILLLTWKERPAAIKNNTPNISKGF